MKKLILLSAFFLAFGVVAQAQVFTFGVKGGVSSSSVDFTNRSPDFAQLENEAKITGFHGGIFTRLKVLGFLLQPEAVLSSSGGKFEVPDDLGNTTVQEVGFTHLDVPLLVGYNVLFARAYAGPVASMLLGSDYGSKEAKDFFNSSDWGYQAGVGVDISRITLDVRYERLKRSYVNPSTGSVDLRNQQLMVSLGYKFIGK